MSDEVAIKSIDVKARDYFQVVTNLTFTSARITVTHIDDTVNLLYFPYQECHYEKKFFDKLGLLLADRYSMPASSKRFYLVGYCRFKEIRLSSSIEWICSEKDVRSWGEPDGIAE